MTSNNGKSRLDKQFYSEIKLKKIFDDLKRDPSTLQLYQLKRVGPTIAENIARDLNSLIQNRKGRKNEEFIQIIRYRFLFLSRIHSDLSKEDDQYEFSHSFYKAMESYTCLEYDVLRLKTRQMREEDVENYKDYVEERMISLLNNMLKAITKYQKDSYLLDLIVIKILHEDSDYIVNSSFESINFIKQHKEQLIWKFALATLAKQKIGLEEKVKNLSRRSIADVQNDLIFSHIESIIYTPYCESESILVELMADLDNGNISNTQMSYSDTLINDIQKVEIENNEDDNEQWNGNFSNCVDSIIEIDDDPDEDFYDIKKEASKYVKDEDIDRTSDDEDLYDCDSPADADFPNDNGTNENLDLSNSNNESNLQNEKQTGNNYGSANDSIDHSDDGNEDPVSESKNESLKIEPQTEILDVADASKNSNQNMTENASEKVISIDITIDSDDEMLEPINNITCNNTSETHTEFEMPKDKTQIIDSSDYQASSYETRNKVHNSYQNKEDKIISKADSSIDDRVIVDGNTDATMNTEIQDNDGIRNSEEFSHPKNIPDKQTTSELYLNVETNKTQAEVLVSDEDVVATSECNLDHNGKEGNNDKSSAVHNDKSIELEVLNVTQGKVVLDLISDDSTPKTNSDCNEKGDYDPNGKDIERMAFLTEDKSYKTVEPRISESIIDSTSEGFGENEKIPVYDAISVDESNSKQVSENQDSLFFVPEKLITDEDIIDQKSEDVVSERKSAEFKLFSDNSDTRPRECSENNLKIGTEFVNLETKSAESSNLLKVCQFNPESTENQSKDAKISNESSEVSKEIEIDEERNLRINTGVSEINVLDDEKRKDKLLEKQNTETSHESDMSISVEDNIFYGLDHLTDENQVIISQESPKTLNTEVFDSSADKLQNFNEIINPVGTTLPELKETCFNVVDDRNVGDSIFEEKVKTKQNESDSSTRDINYCKDLVSEKGFLQNTDTLKRNDQIADDVSNTQNTLLLVPESSTSNIEKTNKNCKHEGVVNERNTDQTLEKFKASDNSAKKTSNRSENELQINTEPIVNLETKSVSKIECPNLLEVCQSNVLRTANQSKNVEINNDPPAKSFQKVHKSDTSNSECMEAPKIGISKMSALYDYKNKSQDQQNKETPHENEISVEDDIFYGLDHIPIKNQVIISQESPNNLDPEIFNSLKEDGTAVEDNVSLEGSIIASELCNEPPPFVEKVKTDEVNVSKEFVSENGIKQNVQSLKHIDITSFDKTRKEEMYLPKTDHEVLSKLCPHQDNDEIPCFEFDCMEFLQHRVKRGADCDKNRNCKFSDPIHSSIIPNCVKDPKINESNEVAIQSGNIKAQEASTIGVIQEIDIPISEDGNNIGFIEEILDINGQNVNITQEINNVSFVENSNKEEDVSNKIEHEQNLNKIVQESGNVTKLNDSHKLEPVSKKQSITQENSEKLIFPIVENPTTQLKDNNDAPVNKEIFDFNEENSDAQSKDISFDRNCTQEIVSKLSENTNNASLNEELDFNDQVGLIEEIIDENDENIPQELDMSSIKQSQDVHKIELGKAFEFNEQNLVIDENPDGLNKEREEKIIGDKIVELRKEHNLVEKVAEFSKQIGDISEVSNRLGRENDCIDCNINQELFTNNTQNSEQICATSVQRATIESQLLSITNTETNIEITYEVHDKVIFTKYHFMKGCHTDDKSYISPAIFDNLNNKIIVENVPGIENVSSDSESDEKLDQKRNVGNCVQCPKLSMRPFVRLESMDLSPENNLRVGYQKNNSEVSPNRKPMMTRRRSFLIADMLADNNQKEVHTDDYTFQEQHSTPKYPKTSEDIKSISNNQQQILDLSEKGYNFGDVSSTSGENATKTFYMDPMALTDKHEALLVLAHEASNKAKIMSSTNKLTTIKEKVQKKDNKKNIKRSTKQEEAIDQKIENTNKNLRTAAQKKSYDSNKDSSAITVKNISGGQENIDLKHDESLKKKARDSDRTEKSKSLKGPGNVAINTAKEPLASTQIKTEPNIKSRTKKRIMELNSADEMKVVTDESNCGKSLEIDKAINSKAINRIRRMSDNKPTEKVPNRNNNVEIDIQQISEKLINSSQDYQTALRKKEKIPRRNSETEIGPTKRQKFQIPESKLIHFKSKTDFDQEVEILSRCNDVGIDTSATLILNQNNVLTEQSIINNPETFTSVLNVPVTTMNEMYTYSLSQQISNTSNEYTNHLEVQFQPDDILQGGFIDPRWLLKEQAKSGNLSPTKVYLSGKKRMHLEDKVKTNETEIEKQAIKNNSHEEEKDNMKLVQAEAANSKNSVTNCNITDVCLADRGHKSNSACTQSESTSQSKNSDSNAEKDENVSNFNMGDDDDDLFSVISSCVVSGNNSEERQSPTDSIGFDCNEQSDALIIDDTGDNNSAHGNTPYDSDLTTKNYISKTDTTSNDCNSLTSSECNSLTTNDCSSLTSHFASSFNKRGLFKNEVEFSNSLQQIEGDILENTPVVISDSTPMEIFSKPYIFPQMPVSNRNLTRDLYDNMGIRTRPPFVFYSDQIDANRSTQIKSDSKQQRVDSNSSRNYRAKRGRKTDHDEFNDLKDNCKVNDKQRRDSKYNSTTNGSYKYNKANVLNRSNTNLSETNLNDSYSPISEKSRNYRYNSRRDECYKPYKNNSDSVRNEQEENKYNRYGSYSKQSTDHKDKKVKRGMHDEKKLDHQESVSLTNSSKSKQITSSGKSSWHGSSSKNNSSQIINSTTSIFGSGKSGKKQSDYKKHAPASNAHVDELQNFFTSPVSKNAKWPSSSPIEQSNSAYSVDSKRFLEQAKQHFQQIHSKNE